MIKVIKHGYARYQTQCNICECEFEYGLEDIQRGKKECVYVACPDCGEHCLHISTLNCLWGSRIEDGVKEK